MTDPQEPQQPPPNLAVKKGVTVNIMFPCDDDDKALAIKKEIDNVLSGITEKRYTFSISEV